MNVRRLGRGETIAAGSAMLLLLVMFAFSWFSSADVAGSGANAWQSFGYVDFVLFVTILAALALAVITVTAESVNKPVAGSAAVALLGAISTLLVLFKIAFPPDLGGYGVESLVDIGTSREIGVWLGLILTAGITYGGWVGMQEDGARRAASARQRRQPPPARPRRPRSGEPGG